MIEVKRIDHCANVHCSNRAAEGVFANVSMAGVTIVVCMPCAEKIMKDFETGYDKRRKRWVPVGDGTKGHMEGK